VLEEEPDMVDVLMVLILEELSTDVAAGESDCAKVCAIRQNASAKAATIDVKDRILRSRGTLGSVSPVPRVEIAYVEI